MISKRFKKKNLRDLISKLWLKNPEKRLTAKEAYNHIFFQ
jgi:serine/threonine protein kinase